jgi:hypothetical protein
MINRYKNLNDYNKLLNTKIISNDINAYQKYKKYRHIYNKLWLAESQDLPSAPIGIYPNTYPIIIKPIINLFGMSRGISIINNEEEYSNFNKDGFFWEKYLIGKHYTLDIILKNGNIMFVGGFKSIKDENGSFKYHKSVRVNFKLPLEIRYWINKYLNKYTGCLNLEIIQDTDKYNYIIEAHLRLNGDFQLYDENFVIQLSKILNKHSNSIDYKYDKKYLIPIFIEKGIKKENINLKKIYQIFNDFLKDKDFKIYSLLEDNIDSKNQSEYLNRLFIFDCNDLEKGLLLKKNIISSICI